MAKKETKKADKKKEEAGAADKAGMPLFYEAPEALDATKHKKLSLKPSGDMSFAQGVNAVPVNLIEFPQLCHYYPIAFSADGSATPVAILGLRNNENLFLNNKGHWDEDTYIPAYIRRYPFIFSENQDSDQLTLCVDTKAKVITNDGSNPFFDKDGKATQLASNALEFCKSYHTAAQQTMAFSKALADSGLLMERQAEINVADGKKITFSGFHVIDEEKFAKLKDKDFLMWREKGWLPFIYAQLFSGTNWQRLSRVVTSKISKEAA